ncbi:polysaccharide deacetylase family protein [Gammaproteobacteria bacterium]|nr:polysaccharide deacetylase family protein [Gammaproteobacteria bacterium]
MTAPACGYGVVQPHGLMFHRFHSPGSHPTGQGSVPGPELENILRYVGTGRILEPDAWLDGLARGTLSPESICLTFDDGLRSQIDVAVPILDKLDLKAFWFVFSSVFDGGIDYHEVYNRFAIQTFPTFDEFVHFFLSEAGIPARLFETEQYRAYEQDMRNHFDFYTSNDIRFRYIRNSVMNWEDYQASMEIVMAARGCCVDELAKDIWMTEDNLACLASNGHHIGLHSYSHPLVFADLSATEQKDEYHRNRDHITAITGTVPSSMSHPLGSYSGTTLDVLGELGVTCGFRSSMTPGFGLEDKRIANLQLPRADSTDLVKMASA